MNEDILILADWRLAGIVDDTVPPRNPKGDDEEEEEDEDEDDEDDEDEIDNQPPVIREPEPDESPAAARRSLRRIDERSALPAP
jgi:hypothetical protein